ncbi:hypothetical protein ACNKHU_08660 [Shigella flexneri]
MEGNHHQDDDGQVLGWPKRNFTIISISMTAMSIFYEPVNVEYFAMNNWSFLQSGRYWHQSQRY